MQHFIPTLLTTLLCLASLSGQAQTYYVSSSGSDSNSGLSAAQAWKSISKVNTEMRNNIATGATIRFKRGETFIGQLNVTVDNLTVGAYDAGDAPLIRATRWMGKNWVSRGGNLWEVRLPTTLEQVRVLYRGKTSLPLGRHPNLSDPVHQGYYYYESVTQESKPGPPQAITDNDLGSLTSEDWTGSEFVIRFNRWRLVMDTVASQNSGQLTLINAPRLFLPKGGGGYFFQNDIRTLDEQDEWAYDQAAGKIYLYSITDPNTQPYSYTAYDYAVQVNQANGVRIANLALMGSNEAALGITESDNAVADKLTVETAGHYGIDVLSSSAATITQCQVRRTLYDGVHTHDDSPNATVENTTLEDIALVAGMGGNSLDGLTGRGYSAISLNGPNGTARNNVIRRTGGSGIHTEMSVGVIRRNLIERTCFVKDDGGGIYMHSNNDESTAEGPLVEENIIRQVVGNGASNGSDRPDGIEVAEGIYADVNTYATVIRYNTVSDAASGLYIHDSPDHQVYGNTVYGSYRFALRLLASPGASVTGVQVENNVLVETEQAIISEAIRLESKVNTGTGDNVMDLDNYGTFENNYIVQSVLGPEADVVVLSFLHDGSVYETNFCCGQAAVSFTAPEIDELYTTFSNTQVLPLEVPNPEPTNFKLFYSNPSNSAVSRSLPSGSYVDAKGNTYTGSVEIAPWRSVVLFRSEYVESVTFPDPNKWYVLKNRDSGLNMRNANCAKDKQTLVELVSWTGNCAQWRFVPKGNYWHIENRDSGLRIRNAGCQDTSDETLVELWDGTGNCTQWSIIAAVEEGYYHFKNRDANLNIRNEDCARVNDETRVELYDGTGDCAQWQLIAADDYNARSSTLAEKEAVEEKFVEGLRIYPIPARNVLQLGSGEGAFTQLRLTDLSGKELGARVQYEPGGASLSVGSLSQGVYLLHGTFNQQRFVQRVIIQK